jgi:hypothetical protein
MIKLNPYILFLIVLLYSCKEEEFEPFVFSGIPKADMVYHEYNPPFKISLQTDSVKKIKYGTDSIDINLDGKFDLVIIVRLFSEWSDTYNRTCLEESNYPFSGFKTKNGLEIATKSESFPVGLGYSNSTFWVDPIPYVKRIDEIKDWHYSNQLRQSPTLGKLLMWGAPPSLFWGSYGPWYKLTNSELYIGVRMKIDTEYKFGWIKVKVYSRESFEILSYAIEI